MSHMNPHFFRFKTFLQKYNSYIIRILRRSESVKKIQLTSFSKFFFRFILF